MTMESSTQRCPPAGMRAFDDCEWAKSSFQAHQNIILGSKGGSHFETDTAHVRIAIVISRAA
jgi:hypothetical protein